jgi:endonuclease-3 related protein
MTPIDPKFQLIYQRLMERYGPQYWWPAKEPFEMMVGAILTQATAWKNVAKAIESLKKAGAFSPAALRQLPHQELARLIYACGYYNAKARRLKALAEWLGENYHDNLEELFASEVPRLRQELLGIYGVGEETADAIILYAAGKPSFVIDAYTRRIISRLGLAPDGSSYTTYQYLFMSSLSADAALFNEYHALLVRLGKEACRKKPLCDQCCLRDMCQFQGNPSP